MGEFRFQIQRILAEEIASPGREAGSGVGQDTTPLQFCLHVQKEPAKWRSGLDSYNLVSFEDCSSANLKRPWSEVHKNEPTQMKKNGLKPAELRSIVGNQWDYIQPHTAFGRRPYLNLRTISSSSPLAIS